MRHLEIPKGVIDEVDRFNVDTDDAAASIVRLRMALEEIALNCDAGAAGFSTAKSWAAVGKLARDALKTDK